MSQANFLTQLKKELLWLKEPDKDSLQKVLKIWIMLIRNSLKNIQVILNLKVKK